MFRKVLLVVFAMLLVIGFPGVSAFAADLNEIPLRVTTDKVSPQLQDTKIVIKADKGGVANKLFQFWIKDDKGWKVVQDYSSSDSYNWTPQKAGQYSISVYVKDVNSGASVDEFKVIDYQISYRPVKLESITTSKNSPQPADAAIRISTQAVGGNEKLYQFWINDGSGWKVVQAYSNKNYFDWIPKKVGNFSISVYVKDKNSNRAADDFKIIPFTTYFQDISLSNIITDKQSPQSSGVPIKISASATGGIEKLYQFWVKDRNGWKMVQNYSTRVDYLWIPIAPGDYQLSVYVKDKTSTKAVDVFKVINYTVVSNPKINSLSISKLNSEPNDKTVVVKANASGGVERVFQFWTNEGSGWKVAKAYSSSDTFNWVPKSSNFMISVYVKDKYSLKDVDDFKVIQYTGVMGNSIATESQMVQYLLNNNPNKGIDYIRNFVALTISEARIEGIKADVVFAQMMKETNFLKFGGDVNEAQNNFGGLGATGNGEPGLSFPNIQTGIRAVVQHLKGYATEQPLVQTSVDPRYRYIKLGSAPYVEWLGINENPYAAGWATDASYGYDIVKRVNDICKIIPPRTVILDAGHGGSDPGAISGSTYEKNLNIALTIKIAQRLQAKGISVVYTRHPNNDQYISMPNRISFANSQKADLFVSIHHDSSTDSSANGVSTHYSSYRPAVDTDGVYIKLNGKEYPWISEDTQSRGFYYSDNGVKKFVSYDDATAYDDRSPSLQAQNSKYLSNKLSAAFSSLGIYQNKGVKDHNLYVTRWTNMPSVLIEAGFMSNSNDFQKMINTQIQDKMAQTIANEIINFLN